MGDGGCGCSIFKLVLALIALAVVACLAWGAWLMAVSAYLFINGVFDNAADALIDYSPLLLGGAVVYLLSRYGRRHAPALPRTRTLALRDLRPKVAFPRGVIARLPLFRGKVAAKQT